MLLQHRSQRKDTILRIFLTIFCETIGLIVSQKSSAAEAEGRLSKSFRFGRLCSASVIVWIYRCKFVTKFFSVKYTTYHISLLAPFCKFQLQKKGAIFSSNGGKKVNSQKKSLSSEINWFLYVTLYVC